MLVQDGHGNMGSPRRSRPHPKTPLPQIPQPLSAQQFVEAEAGERITEDPQLELSSGSTSAGVVGTGAAAALMPAEPPKDEGEAHADVRPMKNPTVPPNAGVFDAEMDEAEWAEVIQSVVSFP